MKEKIGLLATARKKQPYPAPVLEFYTSPLFQRSIQYAKLHYDRCYFYNAPDGLLLPDRLMHPYDVSIKTFSVTEKRQWAHNVIAKLLIHEDPNSVVIYLHGGKIYRHFLEPELKKQGFIYQVPLEGLGIGQQLAWYDQSLKK